MDKVLMFKAFERFWHWSQAMLIISLLVTGFEIHGNYQLLGWETAVDVHVVLAWTLIGLWIFAIFWHLTTGEWKQYAPSNLDKILLMVNYYSIGIFKGGEKPFHKTRAQKHNPLQRLAYLALEVLILPIIWLSGLLYLFYSFWNDWGLGGIGLEWVALIHTAAAFALLSFVIVHLYMALTMNEKPFSNLKAMITGYEEK